MTALGVLVAGKGAAGTRQDRGLAHLGIAAYRRLTSYVYVPVTDMRDASDHVETADDVVVAVDSGEDAVAADDVATLGYQNLRRQS